MIKKILIGAVVTIGAGLIIVATGWNFLATANMSDKFVSKVDFNLALKALSESNEKVHDEIKSKLDNIYDLLIEHYRLTARLTSSTNSNEIDAEYNFRE